MSRPAKRRRDEARLEIDLLLAVGRSANVALYRNESGKGYTGALRGAIEARFRGSPSLPDLRAILNRHRIAWGLGVGSPDLVGSVAGLFLGLELKTETGQLELTQGPWHAAARSKGARVEVVRTIGAALEVMRDMGGEV